MHTFIIYLLLTLLMPTQNRWELIWNDEFNYSGIPDSTKWQLIIGDGCPSLCGWGNNELQYYTADPDNSMVKDGNLIITARQELYHTRSYTSAKLTSQHKGEWQYGKIEVRAKLPFGKGTWPAIWMLPAVEKLDWPEDGEIDIMEHVGFNQGMIFGSVHTSDYNHTIGTQKFDSIRIDNPENNFYVYTIEWNEEEIIWKVDDTEYHTFKNERKGKGSWPFDQKFYLIINLAVGGNWGGKYGVDPEIWPQDFIIDYVRVYKPL